MMAVPAMLAAMAATYDPSLDTSSLRVLSTGAAPVPLPLLERFGELGIAILQAYGIAEAGGAVAVLDSADALDHLGSTGKPLLALEMRIVGPGGAEVPAGEPGEIVVRGPAVTTGYWNLPEVTAEAIVDGWFHTGDIGVVDEDGYLTIRDRVKDMLISGGENVYPAEVESVLSGHPAVADIAVIGQPSSRWGESACAVVVPGEGFDAEDLLAWSRERLAGFKVPRASCPVEDLPRNASGKILKHELRDRFPGPARSRRTRRAPAVSGVGFPSVPASSARPSSMLRASNGRGFEQHAGRTQLLQPVQLRSVRRPEGGHSIVSGSRPASVAARRISRTAAVSVSRSVDPG